MYLMNVFYIYLDTSKSVHCNGFQIAHNATAEGNITLSSKSTHLLYVSMLRHHRNTNTV